MLPKLGVLAALAKMRDALARGTGRELPKMVTPYPPRGDRTQCRGGQVSASLRPASARWARGSSEALGRAASSAL